MSVLAARTPQSRRQASGFEFLLRFACDHLAAIFLRVVEHPCQQCHSAVPDSSAFCPTCDAPQVRFVPRETSGIPVLVAAGVAPALIRADATHSVAPPRVAVSIRRAGFRAAVNAGAVAAVLSLIPVGGSFLFALPLAGFLCVLLYRRYSSAAEPTPGMGFRLGAGTGLAGFVILITLNAIATLGYHAQDKVHDTLIQLLRQTQSNYADPQMRQTMEYFMTPGGLAFLMVFGSAFMCVLFVLLSGIGGAISAALLRRKLPPQ
jgi:hypothetical protein